MSIIAGDWQCTTQTPMGEMESVMTIVVTGDSFTGQQVAKQGTLELQEGRIDGQDIAWQMQMTKPMKMLLLCTARIEGDRLEGEVRAGGFGAFPMWGTRAA